MIFGILLSIAIVWFVIYSTFLHDNSSMAIGWIILIVGVVIGILIGFFFIKFPKIGAFFIASMSGFYWGLFLFNAVVYKSMNIMYLWLTCGISGFLLGLLSLCKREPIFCHTTSLFGSCIFASGVALLVGSFPNPFTLIDMIEY